MQSRPVIDTSVLLSGLLRPGTPHKLLQQVRAGSLTLISSRSLLAEHSEIIRRPKFQTILARSHIDPEKALNEVR